MSQSEKILIIEDDPVFQEILSAIFSSYQIKVTDTAEQGIEWVDDFLPDLIIMDINLPGMDGYEACQQLRANSSTDQTPILFISEYTSLDDRLKAYGVGGDDYFTKPINNQEVMVKVEKFLSFKRKQSVLAEQLNESYSLVMDMQTTAAYLQTISRFLINMLYCHDMDNMAEIFFKAVKGMNINCILRIEVDGQSVLQSTTGTITRLEHEILGLSSHLDRIFSFGNNRAIFNWKYASVLIRNLDDKIDILAILMDGMEAGIRAIIQEQKLLKMVDSVETENIGIEKNITSLCGEMGNHLQETFLSLGMISSLAMEEEERLSNDVHLYSSKISDELSQLKQNNEKISFLIHELSTLESDEVQVVDDSTDDGLDFF